MNKKELAELTAQEVKKLKKYATPEEISRLGDYLDGTNFTACVYGQMTGDCRTKRAGELIKKCAERSYSLGEGLFADLRTDAKLNGLSEKYITRIYDSPNECHGSLTHFSPIETFIVHKGNDANGNNKMIIDYLKGNIKRLHFVKF